jgi:signal transduction histidine kinase
MDVESSETNDGTRLPRAAVLGFLAGAAAVLGLIEPVHMDAGSVRGAVEMVATMWGLATVGLVFRDFEHTRERQDLLLLGALVAVSLTDFVFSALPALSGTDSVAPGIGAKMGAEILVSVAFVAAALIPSGPVTGGSRRPVVLVGASGIAFVALPWAIGMLSAGGAPDVVGEAGLAAAPHHPGPLTIAIASTALLVLAGVGFTKRARAGRSEAGLLAGASFLLAAARIQYLAMPAVAADWTSPRDAMRLTAYGLLLAAAAHRYTGTRRLCTLAAVRAERERIARDLHEGLAQDLAFIAVYSQRDDTELGVEHPVTVAARRALAVSRGTILDLAASDAPTTGEALRRVADELGARYGVDVTVNIKSDPDPGGSAAVSRGDREELVRLAREAIVNAINHGRAREIEVLLDWSRAVPVLRIVDDGRGIGVGALHRSHGLGVPTMRARAESLGGQLVTRPGARGGTEIEVLLSRAAALR